MWTVPSTGTELEIITSIQWCKSIQFGLSNLLRSSNYQWCWHVKFHSQWQTAYQNYGHKVHNFVRTGVRLIKIRVKPNVRILISVLLIQYLAATTSMSCHALPASKRLPHPYRVDHAIYQRNFYSCSGGTEPTVFHRLTWPYCSITSVCDASMLDWATKIQSHFQEVWRWKGMGMSGSSLRQWLPDVKNTDVKIWTLGLRSILISKTPVLKNSPKRGLRSSPDLDADLGWSSRS